MTPNFSVSKCNIILRAFFFTYFKWVVFSKQHIVIDFSIEKRQLFLNLFWSTDQADPDNQADEEESGSNYHCVQDPSKTFNLKIEFVFTELIDSHGFSTVAALVGALGTVLSDGTVVCIYRLVITWNTLREGIIWLEGSCWARWAKSSIEASKTFLTGDISGHAGTPLQNF